MVDRGADRFGKASVVKRGRNRLVVAREFGDRAVERIGGDARANEGNEKIERLGRQPASLAHAVETRVPMQGNDPRGAAGFGLGIDVSDHQKRLVCLRNSRLGRDLEVRGRRRLVQKALRPLLLARRRAMHAPFLSRLVDD